MWSRIKIGTGITCSLTLVALATFLPIYFFSKRKNDLSNFNNATGYNVTESENVNNADTSILTRPKFIIGPRTPFDGDVIMDDPVFVAGDVNFDGCDEVISFQSIVATGVISALHQNGSLIEQQKLLSHSYSVGSDILLSDFNDDRRLDIAVSLPSENSFIIWFNTATGDFREAEDYFMGDGFAPSRMAASDLNKDGRTDLVVIDARERNLYVLLGVGDGKFAQPVPSPIEGLGRPQSVFLDDFDGDSLMDILIGGVHEDSLCLFFGLGDGTFEQQLLFSTAPLFAYSSLVVGDLSNDHRTDIVLSSNYEESVVLFLARSNRTFQPSVVHTLRTQTTLSFMYTAHLNDDHHLDLVLLNSRSSKLDLFLSTGDGSFNKQPTIVLSEDMFSTAIAFGHFNGDHCTDMIVLSFNPTACTTVLFNVC